MAAPQQMNRRKFLKGIGAGGRGSGEMKSMMGSSNVRKVAVCDVDESRRDKAERFPDDPEAQSMTDRPMRNPWRL